MPLGGYGAALLGEEEIALVTQAIKEKRPFRYYGSDLKAFFSLTDQFEEAFAEKMGVPFALGVTSGTAALEVALGALGVGPGDEVLVPAWSWVSCFTTVAHLGARPVLAEINDTLCLDPSEIDRLCSPRTKAVIVVHYQGAAAEMEEILAAAKRQRIAVLEDCAEAVGASYRGRRVGSLGDLGTYSFQYNKTITSGEGGALVTQEARLYERAVRMHDLGMMRPTHANQVPPQEAWFSGTQFRMSEMTAAVALAQLRKLDKIRTHCKKLSSIVREALFEIPGVRLRRIPDPSGESAIETYFWLPDAGLTKPFSQFLEARNVSLQRTTGTYCHYRREYCLNRRTHSTFSPFAEENEWPTQGYRPEDFPQTEELIQNILAIPVGCYYTESDAQHIADTLRAATREFFPKSQISGTQQHRKPLKKNCSMAGLEGVL